MKFGNITASPKTNHVTFFHRGQLLPYAREGLAKCMREHYVRSTAGVVRLVDRAAFIVLQAARTAVYPEES
jgi:hypothetical protein